ncbi:general negative regulator of transcription subunit 5 [Boothiomyces sp. JEL0866]|nr:general negative regulator of transcription subunit 5 [Boothiomyces sp. JEL0866]KAJ3325727.1 general negative regulator of transcription subunit 5 [Boothiomyces sp. JEL0866]
MANRKLQTEIDRTLKKVTEGVEIFENIYDKIQQATNQSQKEKLEGDLKKEIKKLQRFRDQIKTWASSNDIKDKAPLIESRKLIETQMEKFKAMEKELKTKAYSQAGLNAASKLDPEEIHRDEIRQWISDSTDNLSTQIDALEAEQETLRLKKTRKSDTTKAERLARIDSRIEQHKFHQSKLEIVLRMIDNGNLKPDQVRFCLSKVETIKEDVNYYVAENQEPDFEDNEYIYDDLNLDEAEVYGFGNDDDDADPVDPPTPPQKVEPPPTPKAEPEPKKKEKEPEKEAKPTPPTPKKQKSLDKEKTKQKPLNPTIPKAVAPAIVDPPPPPANLRFSAVAAAAPPTPKPVESIPDTNSEPTIASILMGKSKPNPPPLEKKQAPNSPAVSVTSKPSVAGSPKMDSRHRQSPVVLSSVINSDTKLPAALADLVSNYDEIKDRDQKYGDSNFVNSLVDLSFQSAPSLTDSQKLKPYYPKDPYPVPTYYQQVPLSIFELPGIYERFDTNTLFFIFYYRQGTYQQFLAARELKRQSWRFHKKYSTWFQRHEEPTEVNDQYEQGTYVYFDYENAWTQKKKTNFKFEYKYLEDDLDFSCTPKVLTDPKITAIVDEISKLNLLEVSTLVSELKTKLNIADVVMASGPAAAAPAPAAAADAEPKEEVKAAPTQFKVTLAKFDPASKAKVIKEIKALLPGANLVEAKKFVEGAPKVVRENVPKDEAEKIKAALEAVGATVTLD